MGRIDPGWREVRVPSGDSRRHRVWTWLSLGSITTLTLALFCLARRSEAGLPAPVAARYFAQEAPDWILTRSVVNQLRSEAGSLDLYRSHPRLALLHASESRFLGLASRIRPLLPDHLPPSHMNQAVWFKVEPLPNRTLKLSLKNGDVLCVRHEGGKIRDIQLMQPRRNHLTT